MNEKNIEEKDNMYSAKLIACPVVVHLLLTVVMCIFGFQFKHSQQ